MRVHTQVMGAKRNIEGTTTTRRYYPGQELDVLDTVSKWAEASVVGVSENRVRITYVYWSEKWDEWLDFESSRIRPRGSMTFRNTNPMVGQRVEAYDGFGWLEAEILAVQKSNLVFVHYNNFHRKFDEWVDLHSRVRPFGRNRRQIKREGYVRSLEKRKLVLVRVAGDGNCLFRSVSHQVYGDDSHHAMVRSRCMDYMVAERAFFEPYVAQDFDAYVAEKREDGAWGDEPELQALCELYDRSAQVWSYDGAGGAKVIRAFHREEEATESSGVPPMRLSYFGDGHYDSVVVLGAPPPDSTFLARRQQPAEGDRIMPLPPGVYESAKMDSLLLRRRREREEDDGSASRRGDDEDTLPLLAESRRLFDEFRGVVVKDEDVENAIVASVKEEEMQSAIAVSSQEDADSRLALALKQSSEVQAAQDDASIAAAIHLSQRDLAEESDVDLAKAIAASLEQSQE